MSAEPRRKRKRVLTSLAVIVLAAVVAYLATRREPDLLSVPLGVEQAAIITYSGPVITVAPYKWGVAVNVRIAGVIERDGRRVYDVRYIVNRAGTFDLKDYLAAADGGGLDGLPEFQFVGDPKLSKNLDTRIQETEEIRIDVGGWYYETLALIAVLWIGWLLLLVFYKRPRPPVELDAGPPTPTLADLLRGILVQLEEGTLDAAAKAKLEMILLQCWRNELELGQSSMSASLGEIGRHSKTGEALRKLQRWLHHPASRVDAAEIAAVIAPYTLGSKSTEGTHPA